MSLTRNFSSSKERKKQLKISCSIVELSTENIWLLKLKLEVEL